MQFHRVAAPSRAVAIPPLACPSRPQARYPRVLAGLIGSNAAAAASGRRRRQGRYSPSPIAVVVVSAAAETSTSSSSPSSPSTSSAITAADRAHMRRALELARRGLGSTEPNPAVGCVIVAAAAEGGEKEEGGGRGDSASAAAEVVGEGFHPRAGRPHAEVYALRAAGQRARGGTAYVTLEPCAHHGRTPPCARALIDAGVKRVVLGVVDPNPLVDGGGVSLLRAAGIEVVAIDGAEAEEAAELNPEFMRRMREGAAAAAAAKKKKEEGAAA